MENNPGHQIMNVKEVSEYLRVHPTTLYRLLKRGEVPAFQVGSEWRFNRETIDKWQQGETIEISTRLNRPVIERAATTALKPRKGPVALKDRAKKGKRKK